MSEALLLIGDSYSDQDLYYKTHFLAGDTFVYYETNGHRRLLLSKMEQGRAAKESSVREIQTYEEFGYRELAQELNDPIKAFKTVLVNALKGAGVSSVVSERRFPAFYADHLRAEGISVDIRPRLLGEVRRQKSPEEIASMEEAQRAAERAMAIAAEMVRQSEERDGLLYLSGQALASEAVRAQINVSLLEDNMDISQSPIVAAGPRAADPHWKGEGTFRAGESIILDLFPRNQRGRYFADMTRTVIKGQAPDILKRMYDSTHRALEAAFAEIRAGANGNAVHEAVITSFKKDGFSVDGPGPRYSHGTGHGVGLDIHELPPLSTQSVELRENDVITVEPGLYDPEIGGVRIEDLVVVTLDGFRNLTNFPYDFEV
jgi:Xaa-Pro aminopeptidase